MIKLLVPLQWPAEVEPALDFVLALARDLDAHVEAFHAQPDPGLLIPPVFDGATGLSQLGQLLIEVQAAAAARAAEIAAVVEARATHDDLPRLARPGFSLAYASRRGDPERLIAHQARLADLVVLLRGDGDPPQRERPALDAALWRGPRPILLAPTGLTDRRVGRPRRAVLAWNGSAEAARALSAALPLLEGRGVVDVVAIDGVLPAEELDGVARYLASHGIDSTVASLVSRGYPLCEVLFDRVIDGDADLLIMGAYTHSRWREFVLGGLTQQILADAPIPVLLAH